MEPLSAEAQLHFLDSMQRRSEAIRPMLLLGERTATQRAEELHLHPDTVREWLRRFQHQGMLGLLQAQTAVVTPSRGESERLCHKVAFWRPNPKIGCQKINGLRD